MKAGTNPYLGAYVVRGTGGGNWKFVSRDDKEEELQRLTQLYLEDRIDVFDYQLRVNAI